MTIICQHYWIHLINAKIEVPREEFFIAVRHYCPQGSLSSLLSTYEHAEHCYEELNLAIPKLGLQAYQTAMYKEGRALQNVGKGRAWDKFKRTLHLDSPRPLIIDQTKKDHLND